MRIYGCLLFMVVISVSCLGQDCGQMPRHFNSYGAAIAFVKKAQFRFSDDINTSRSSWIRSASYYSCDGITGYFIFTTDTKEYIHSDVPVALWKQFKVAPSFGSYYDRNIRGKYRFRL